jgi:glycosyltransferase involved in cell wall biosynthesis
MKETEYVIIVPAYNAEKYLARCIESVISQDYPRLRLVIVDDGSTDATGEIAGRYAAAHGNITVLTQENQGQIMARSKGIGYAIGHSDPDAFFLFIDADDELKPDSLSRIHTLIRENGCDMLIFGAEKVDASTGRLIGRLSDTAEGAVDSKAELYRIVLYDFGYNSLCRKAISRRVMESADYRAYAHLRFGEDLIQSLDYYRNTGRVFFTREVFYRYHINRESVTQRVDFYSYPIDSTVRRLTWEFVTAENVWTQDELNDYAQFLLNLLERKLVALCCFNVPYAEKARVLDDVRQDGFYAMLLSMPLRRGRVITLLLQGRYRRLIQTARLTKIARRLRRR